MTKNYRNSEFWSVFMFLAYQLFLLVCILFVWMTALGLYIDNQTIHAANPSDFSLLDRIFPLLLGLFPTLAILWFSYVTFKERSIEHDALAHPNSDPLSEDELKMVMDEWLPLAKNAGLMPDDFNSEQFEAFIAEFEAPDFEITFLDFLNWLNEYSLGYFDIENFDPEELGTLPRLMIDTFNVEEDAQVYSYMLREADRISGGCLELENLIATDIQVDDDIDVNLSFEAKGNQYDWTIHTVGKWIDDGFVSRLCSLINMHSKERKLYVSGEEEIVLISLDGNGRDLLKTHLHLELIQGLDLHSPFENRRSRS